MIAADNFKTEVIETGHPQQLLVKMPTPLYWSNYYCTVKYLDRRLAERRVYTRQLYLIKFRNPLRYRSTDMTLLKLVGENGRCKRKTRYDYSFQPKLAISSVVSI